jgi:shikimate kinase
MKKIILCGYMASGKSTVGPLLATASGLKYIDLDAFIEHKTGKTISWLIQDSEIKFRKTEHEALKEIMENDENFVLSLGGGTPCYANNHLFLQQEDVISVYLKASIPEIIKRLAADTTPRPLLKNLSGEALHEFIAQHLFERSYFYMKARHVINTDNKAATAIVNEIMSLY